MKRTPTISSDAWQEALRALTVHEDPSALTTHEIAKLWDCSDRTAKARVAKLVDAGMAKAMRKTIRDIAGRFLQVPAYVLWTKPKGPA